MSNGLVSLRQLWGNEVTFAKRDFVALKDRNVRDTESIATTDTSKSFFETLSTKKKSQANFQGDKSLIREANLFLILQARAFIRNRLPTNAEFMKVFNTGYYELKKLTPDTITIDEDNLLSLTPGCLSTRNSGGTLAIDEALPGDSRQEGRRTYISPENKMYPGGRTIEFKITWEEGANGLASAAEMVIEFYGIEFEPKKMA